MISGISGFSQITNPTYWDRRQYGANWIFDYDTVRINRLMIDQKFGVDSTGNIFYYNNSAPAAKSLLVGNGSKFTPLAGGSALQYLRVNAAGTALEYATPGAGTITGLTDNLILYGKADGTIDQTTDISYNGIEFYVAELSHLDGGLKVGGESGFQTLMNDEGKFTEYYGTAISAGDILYGDNGGGVMSLLGLGSANQLLHVKSDGTNLEWFTPSFLTSEVDGSTTNEVQNLSWNSGTHAVDISLSGTSAVIPYAAGATEGIVSNTTQTFNGAKTFTNDVTLSGKVASYNGITTANNGVPSSVGTPVHLTGQTANIGATSLYTTTADGFYSIYWNAAITTAATTGAATATLGHFQIQYTNVADNVVKTTPTANNVTASSANAKTGTGSGISGVITVYAKSGTNINYIMGYSSNTAAQMTYSLDITVVKL